MSTDTINTPAAVVARAQQTVKSRTVFIRANRPGVVPMERFVDGVQQVSTCDYNAHTGKMVNVKTVRPLRFGDNGVQVIDPSSPADLALLAECKLWLAEGTDSRIARFGIEIQEGGSAEGAPIPRYDLYKPAALVERMTAEVDLIADDAATVREFLESCARYELQRVYPAGHQSAGKPNVRQKILDAIDDLGVASGIEYGTDEVGEE